jgi:hypothetical protein
MMHGQQDIKFKQGYIVSNDHVIRPHMIEMCVQLQFSSKIRSPQTDEINFVEK